jgi:hypothetical protein
VCACVCACVGVCMCVYDVACSFPRSLTPFSTLCTKGKKEMPGLDTPFRALCRMDVKSQKKQKKSKNSHTYNLGLDTPFSGTMDDGCVVRRVEDMCRQERVLLEAVPHCRAVHVHVHVHVCVCVCLVCVVCVCE